MVVIGQAIEKIARHRDFDADRVVDALRVIESGSGGGRLAHGGAPMWRSDLLIIHIARVRLCPVAVCECRHSTVTVSAIRESGRQPGSGQPGDHRKTLPVRLPM